MSQDLWDLVENGYVEPENATAYNNLTVAQKNELKDCRKKDSKALLVIQQAVHESIFPRIAAANKSKDAWKILKDEYQGTDKVITVKLQT